MCKHDGMLKKLKFGGLEKVSWLFTFVGAAQNLVGCGGCRRRPERERKESKTILKAPNPHADGHSPPVPAIPLPRLNLSANRNRTEIHRQIAFFDKLLGAANGVYWPLGSWPCHITWKRRASVAGYQPDNSLQDRGLTYEILAPRLP
jgi:hypothetical protein